MRDKTMHGLINKALQCFLRDTYGEGLWAAVARDAGLGFDSFEPMLQYDLDQTRAVIAAAARLLDRPAETVLEDMGTYLVSHPNLEPLRRLLRFGGVTFPDFLHSLEDMRGRGRLALPDLDLPTMDLRVDGEDRYVLACRSPLAGAGHVIMGLLRAMADDYGALVLLDHLGTGDGAEEIAIHLPDARFAEGRRFDLSRQGGPDATDHRSRPQQDVTGPEWPETGLPWLASSAADSAGREGPETDGAVLGTAALDALMPLHMTLDRDGRILSAGPTLVALLPGLTLCGQMFFDLFDIRRPDGIGAMADLRRRAGVKLVLGLRGQSAHGFAGIAVPAGGGGLLVNLSFGIGIIEAVRAHNLTDADFTATDLAMELLYLVEAKSAVMQELRALNLRLQGAKHAAETQALTDTLTGLSNRRALDSVLAEAVARRLPFGLMHIDLDYFKAVNDTLGHAAGDHVLREVARVLREETRRNDTVARVGGDEFVMVFPGMTQPPDLSRIAGRIVSRLTEPFLHEGRLCRISASIGIAISTAYESLTVEQILGDADSATYASKHAGRGRALFHRRVTDGPEVQSQVASAR